MNFDLSMRELKVAYFIGALNRGGAENLICDICRRHKQIPYDFVCVYRHEGNMSDAFKSTGAPMIHVAKKGGMLRYLLDVRKVLRQEHITIVHSQTPQNTLLLAIALLGTGIKVITTFHGYNFSKAPWWQQKIVYNVSKKILCVSEHQKSVYEQRWHLPNANKLEVLYNGIDFTKIDGVKNERVRELGSERVKLAMVGNFVDVRSQIVVVKAIARLDAMRLEPKDLDATHLVIPEFDFYFVGKRVEQEAALYDECVKYCEEHQLNNVHFLGSRGDVPEILKTVDGFVYSTALDTFGIAVIEAIAAGLPIVVNDWPVMTEVCGAENEGIRYFHTEDAEDAAAKIAMLLSNLEESKIVAKENAKRMHEKYSIEQHINHLNSIYQSL